MPLVFAGTATLDAIALVSSFPRPDERLIAEAVSYAGGGPATTAAVAAARRYGGLDIEGFLNAALAAWPAGHAARGPAGPDGAGERPAHCEEVRGRP